MRAGIRSLGIGCGWLTMTNRNKPKVSVLLLTYNHEKYIEQGLEGIVRQQTQFDFDIVIAEDASQDGTARLVRAFAAEHPGRVHLFCRPRNLGLCRNFAEAYSACRGEYVAILEGDDIWHDPRKLQRQADALDLELDCSFVFHDVRLLFQDGKELASCCPDSQKHRLELKDFVAHNFVPNCSAIMFRHRLIPQFPDWFLRLSYYDWPLHVLHLERGNALYLNESLSTYRIHDASAWHGASPTYRLEKALEVIQALNEHLLFRHDSIFQLNGNFLKLQFENQTLRHELAVCKQEIEASRNDRADLLRSRAIRIAQLLSKGQKRFTRLLGVRAE
jgi:glycosyltransferase involved in cell wall biosynthesis